MKTVEERIAEFIATLVLIGAAAYFVGHVVAAVMRGALHIAIQAVNQ
jgi:hypothetical protein